MNSIDNLQIVKQHFEAFGRGDFQSALSMFSEDVDFQSPVTHTPSKDITWAKPRHNSKEIGAFFQELGEKLLIDKMELYSFTSEENRVVVEGRNKGTVKLTGEVYDHDWVMLFTLENGKIIKCRHYYDTAEISNAFLEE